MSVKLEKEKEEKASSPPQVETNEVAVEISSLKPSKSNDKKVSPSKNLRKSLFKKKT